MPCCDAMITDVISVKPDDTIAEVLNVFEKNAIRGAPVVDEQNNVIGKISFNDILNGILPLPVTLEGGLRKLPKMDISLAHISGASPWVAKRLHNLLPSKVSSIMNKDPRTVNPQTPLREGVRLLVKYGSPLMVVKDGTKELDGIISSQTTIKRLIVLEREICENKRSIDN